MALLNAIGSWRQSLRQDVTTDNPAIEAPGGWENVNTKGRLFDIIPTEHFSDFNDTKFCLLNKETHPAAWFGQADADGKPLLHYTDALKQFLSLTVDFDVIVSVLNGSELAVACIQPDFDFFPYDDDDGDRPPIDSLYINQWTRQAVSWVQASLTVMRHSLPHKKIIHIAPPPPLLNPEDNGRTVRHLRPSLRMKIHCENMKRMRKVTSSLNIPFLEERPGALTADGFLKPEFDDGHSRGNVEFGRLTAREVLKLI